MEGQGIRGGMRAADGDMETVFGRGTRRSIPDIIKNGVVGAIREPIPMAQGEEANEQWIRNNSPK